MKKTLTKGGRMVQSMMCLDNSNSATSNQGALTFKKGHPSTTNTEGFSSTGSSKAGRLINSVFRTSLGFVIEIQFLKSIQVFKAKGQSHSPDKSHQLMNGNSNKSLESGIFHLKPVKSQINFALSLKEVVVIKNEVTHAFLVQIKHKYVELIIGEEVMARIKYIVVKDKDILTNSLKTVDQLWKGKCPFTTIIQPLKLIENSIKAKEMRFFNKSVAEKRIIWAESEPCLPANANQECIKHKIVEKTETQPQKFPGSLPFKKPRMTLNLNNKVLKKTLFLKFNTETKLMNHSKKSMIEEKSMNTSIEQNFGDSLRRKFSFHSQSKEDLMLNKEMPESEQLHCLTARMSGSMILQNFKSKPNTSDENKMMIYPINEEPQKPICGFLNKQLSPTRRVSDLETQIKQYRQGKYGYKQPLQINKSTKAVNQTARKVVN